MIRRLMVVLAATAVLLTSAPASADAAYQHVANTTNQCITYAAGDAAANGFPAGSSWGMTQYIRSGDLDVSVRVNVTVNGYVWRAYDCRYPGGYDWYGGVTGEYSRWTFPLCGNTVGQRPYVGNCNL